VQRAKLNPADASLQVGNGKDLAEGRHAHVINELDGPLDVGNSVHITQGLHMLQLAPAALAKLPRRRWIRLSTGGPAVLFQWPARSIGSALGRDWGTADGTSAHHLGAHASESVWRARPPVAVSSSTTSSRRRARTLAAQLAAR